MQLKEHSDKQLMRLLNALAGVVDHYSRMRVADLYELAQEEDRWRQKERPK